jgi:hypothetical protein
MFTGEPTYVYTYGNNLFNHTWYIVEDRQEFVFQVQACQGAMLVFLTYTASILFFTQLTYL